MKEIYKEMDKRGVEAFCLDSGYVHAQLVWKKKFGTPDYIFKDYWDIGYDHMIWKLSIREVRK